MKRFGRFMLLFTTSGVLFTSCLKERAISETNTYALREYNPGVDEIVPLVQDFKKGVEQYKNGMKSVIDDKSPEEALWLMEASINYDYRHPITELENKVLDSVEYKVYKYPDTNGKIKLDGNDILAKYISLSQEMASIVDIDEIMEVADIKFKDVSEINDNNLDSVRFTVYATKGDPKDDDDIVVWTPPNDTTCLDALFDNNGTMTVGPAFIDVCDNWFALDPGRCDGQVMWPTFSWKVMEYVINHNYQHDFILQAGGLTSQALFYTNVDIYTQVDKNILTNGINIMNVDGTYPFTNPDGTYYTPGLTDFNTLYASTAHTCINDGTMKSRVDQLLALINALKGLHPNRHFISMDLIKYNTINIQNYHVIQSLRLGVPIFYSGGASKD